MLLLLPGSCWGLQLLPMGLAAPVSSSAVPAPGVLQLRQWGPQLLRRGCLPVQGRSPAPLACCHTPGAWRCWTSLRRHHPERGGCRLCMRLPLVRG
jgi:hypothetical protein